MRYRVSDRSKSKVLKQNGIEVWALIDDEFAIFWEAMIQLFITLIFKGYWDWDYLNWVLTLNFWKYCQIETKPSQCGCQCITTSNIKNHQSPCNSNISYFIIFLSIKNKIVQVISGRSWVDCLFMLFIFSQKNGIIFLLTKS